MAKPTPNKPASKPDSSNEGGQNATPQESASAAEPKPVSESVESGKEAKDKPGTSSPATVNAKKDASANRPKKPSPSPSKGSPLMPSPHKLENLKAAVAAAGGVDNLLTILQHVDDAGGRQEVTESIEAYRALKTALED